MDEFGNPQPQDFLAPASASPYGADAFASMGGVSNRDMLAQIQAMQQQRDAANQTALAQMFPQQEQLDTRVPIEQFVDLPTYQKVVPNLSPTQAYDEYLQVALPRQLEDMGMSPEEQKAAIEDFKKNVQRPEETGFLQRYVTDPLLTLGKGIIGAGEAAVGLADIPTFGYAGKFLEEGLGYRPDEAKKILTSMMSPEQQQALEAMAKADGVEATLRTALQYPSLIPHAVIESAPSLIGGGGVARAAGRGLLGARAAAWSPVARGALGEATISGGQNVEQIRQDTPGSVLSPGQVALGAGSGAVTGGLTLGAGRLANRLGIADINTLLAGGSAGPARRGLARVGSVAGGITEEGLLQEAPQSAQEQIAQNIATGKPWDQGIGQAAAMGAIVGGALGGGVNVFGGHAPAAAPAPQPGVAPGVAPGAAPGVTPAGPLPPEAGLAAFAQPPGGPPPGAPLATNVVTPEAVREEVYARTITEGVRDLIREQGVPLNDTVYAKELDGIAEADNPVAAINDAITALQGRTGAQVEPTVAALENIRDQIAAVETLDTVRGAQARGITPVQDAIRSTLNIQSTSGIKRVRQAWIEHFERLNAVREPERAAAEIRIMEAERAEMLDRQARSQAVVAAATVEGGGGTAPTTYYSPAAMTEASSRIDDALGAIEPIKQDAIRQRANQILKETVNAANQRANQRRDAGYPRAQPSPPGGPDLVGTGPAGGGVAAAGGTAARPNRPARLSPQQRAAVGRVGTSTGSLTGTGSTIADRLIQQIEDGRADPNLLALLALADQVTREIVTEAATPAPTAAPTEVPRAQPAQTPAAQAAAPVVPTPGSIGAGLLSYAPAVPSTFKRGGGKAAAEPAGGVRAGTGQEVTAPRGRKAADTGRGISDFRRGVQNAPVVADDVGGTAQDAERRKLKRETIDKLITEHGYTREEATNLANVQEDSIWEVSEGNGDTLKNVGAPGRLAPNIERAVTNGSVDTALETIKTTFADPLQRAIAGRLQEVGLTATLDMGELPGRTKGEYNPRNNAITIDPNKGDDETVLHEITHAGTQAALRNPQTEQQKAAAKRMNELYEYAKAHPKSAGRQKERGFHSVEEFVAEAFSNTRFQNLLRSIPLPGASTQGPFNALSAFKKFVLNLLGVNSVLAETVMTGEDLLDSRVFSLSAKLANEATAEQAKADGQAFAGRPKDSLVGVDRNGVRRAIAYKQKDGTYWHYDVDPEGDPRGTAGTVTRKLTRQEVERKFAESQLAPVGPQTDTEAPTATPPKATKDMLPGYRNGKLQFVAYEQDDGTWNVYESVTDNVTTDPAAQVTRNVANKAAVQARMGTGGYAGQPPSVSARAATGGGGGSNTLNQSGPATLTPGGPPKDLTLPATSKLKIRFKNRFEALQTLGRALQAHFEKYNAQVPDWARVDWHAVLRNSRAKQHWDGFVKKHVEPVRGQAVALMQKYGKSQEQIERDQINLHFEERADNKERSLDPDTDWTTPEAQAYLQKLASDKLAAQRANDELKRTQPAYFAELVKLSERSKQMSDDTIDLAVAYGLMTADTGQRIKSTYKYYVPIQTGAKTKTGGTATGASAAGESPFQRLQEQAMHTIMRGEQNSIRRRVYELATQLVTPKDADGRPIFKFTTPAQGRIKVDPRDFTVGFVADSVSPLDPRAVAVFIDGKRHYMSIADDGLFEALRMFSGAEQQTAMMSVIGAMSYLNHFSAMGKTALNPGFAVFNLARDVGVSFAQLPKEYSRGRFLVHLGSPSVWGSSFVSAFNEAFGKDAVGVYKQVQDAGGLVTPQAMAGLDPLVAEVNGKFNPSTGLKLKQGLKRPTDTALFKFMAAFSQALESGTRLAIYNTVLEKHKAEGMSDEAAKLRAAVQAKTTTVNFEQRGTVPLGPLYLFANAKIQGMSTFYDKLINEKNPYTQAATVSMIALGLMAAALGYKDSDKDKDGKSKYGKIQQNKRDSMFIAHEGATGVPLPQELAPFYALGNTIGDMLWGDTEAAGDRVSSRMLRVLMQTFSPLNTPQQDITGYKANPADYLMRMVVPSVFLPIYDIGGNKNTFGSEIVSNKDKQRAAGVPLREMYSKNENTLAVNMAKGIYQTTGFDVAPAQLKYLATAFDPTAAAFWVDLFGADKPPSYAGQERNPLLRRFSTTATSFADDENYNIAKQDALEAKYFAANPQALRRGGTPGMDTQRLASLQALFTQTDRQISALYKDFKQRPQAQDLAINTQKQALQQQALKQYYQITGKGGGG